MVFMWIMAVTLHRSARFTPYSVYNRPRLLFPFGALYGVIASPPPVGIILVKTREPHGGRESHKF